EEHARPDDARRHRRRTEPPDHDDVHEAHRHLHELRERERHREHERRAHLAGEDPEREHESRRTEGRRARSAPRKDRTPNGARADKGSLGVTDTNRARALFGYASNELFRPMSLPAHALDADAASGVELHAYRVVCLLTAVFVPAFGYVYHVVDPGFHDPLWL